MTSFMPEGLPERPEDFPVQPARQQQVPGQAASSASAAQPPMGHFTPQTPAGGQPAAAPQQFSAPQPASPPQPLTGQQPVQRQPFGVQQTAVQPSAAQQAATAQAAAGQYGAALAQQTAVQPVSGQQPVQRQPMSGQQPVQRQPMMGQQSAPAQPSAPAGQQRPAGAQAQRPAASAPVGGSRLGMGQEKQEGDFDLQSALRAMLAAKASDLHITSGAAPMIRVDGGLKAVEGFDRLTPEGIQKAIFGIITQKQRESFDEHLELDFSYSLIGEARFRVNIYRQRNAVGAAFRVIPYEIKALEALGVPEAVSKFAYLPRGLVLVTGPTGSGKSTTLASLVDLANRSRSGHIMTVEDPIEFLHRHKRSLVNQREVGTDTKSFANALKHVLRQDPDVILIGEAP
ncbi:type IV pilus twitching motility protein PilT [Demequina litorisediminis]|nr:ATPase, T2SS/T4P/T4SS family [Demequina litorisediminis]